MNGFLDGAPEIEERHRGSRELIRARLNAYRPFVDPLLRFYPDAAALDLGCGRGEWLEVLGEAGFLAQGVEVDPGMLQACKERGLRVKQGEGGAFVATLPDESLAVVSAFHVVEHIAFDELREWVRQAMRVLRPGGLLILETPNPENILVATSSFYLDPTHRRPIPPELLTFVVEYYGFARVRTVRLQEQPELRGSGKVGLLDVLGGASPDYSVVAQKRGGAAITQALDAAFAAEFGLTVEALSTRYDRQLGSIDELAARFETLRSARIDERLGRLEAAASQSQRRTEAAEAALRAQEQRIDEFRGSVLHWQSQAAALEAERDALRSSWSWRLSAPLRVVGGIAGTGLAALRGAADRLSLVSIGAFHGFLGRLIRVVLRRPELSHRINQLLLRYPALYKRLVAIANRQGIYSLFQGSAADASASIRGFDRGGPGLGNGLIVRDGRVRKPLTGTDGDLDELLLRIEEELAQWRTHEVR